METINMLQTEIPEHTLKFRSQPMDDIKIEERLEGIEQAIEGQTKAFNSKIDGLSRKIDNLTETVNLLVTALGEQKA